MDDFSPAWSLARRTLLKSAILVLAVACLTYVPFIVLGLWNRVFGGWQSVFFCYAGSRNFVSSYAPSPAVNMFRWRPSPIGVLTQNGTHGLVLAAPVTEADFLDPANAQLFRKLRVRLKRVARLLGVAEVSLAGILPGVLRDDDVLEIPDKRQIVAATVKQAVDEVVAKRFGGTRPTIIVLGGRGFIGQPTTDALRTSGYDCRVVDPRSGVTQLPEDLSGAPALLVDVSRHSAIEAYIPQMWPDLVVLNETFPRPAARNTALMTSMGVDVYHVSGVAGTVRPPLPFGYEDSVPCCAAHAPPGPGEAQVVKLTPRGGQVPPNKTRS